MQASDLPSLLRYDPETGKLFWLYRTPEMFSDGATYDAAECCRRFNRTWAGKEAFTALCKGRYRQGTIWLQRIEAHRVIWALVYGEWPQGDIDHINGDGLDNRLGNLRLCRHAENMRNMKIQSGRASAFKGVSPSRQDGKWRAHIKIDGRHVHLGTFADEEAAARAYDDAASKYHGPFGRPNFPMEKSA